ncbi:hypothetical protein L486_07712 [Kwoniella mangroviensis CBS 10435]|uniref:Uncharacterized protein n=1 Tax=Kwoniella mangroviensis CBS 10435 TaxID=1331196 RepID=A0A1B9IGW4_9TREE|nr:hypothetical protein L486_07712 [Kwoniella mangroviensis CBS 10435]
MTKLENQDTSARRQKKESPDPAAHERPDSPPLIDADYNPLVTNLSNRILSASSSVVPQTMSSIPSQSDLSTQPSYFTPFTAYPSPAEGSSPPLKSGQTPVESVHPALSTSCPAMDQPKRPPSKRMAFCVDELVHVGQLWDVYRGDLIGCDGISKPQHLILKLMRPNAFPDEYPSDPDDLEAKKKATTSRTQLSPQHSEKIGYIVPALYSSKVPLYQNTTVFLRDAGDADKGCREGSYYWEWEDIKSIELGSPPLREVDYKKVDFLWIELYPDSPIGQTRLRPKAYPEFLLKRHFIPKKESTQSQQPQFASDELRASLSQLLAPTSISSPTTSATTLTTNTAYDTPTVYATSPEKTILPAPVSISSDSKPRADDTSDTISNQPDIYAPRNTANPDSPNQMVFCVDELVYVGKLWDVYRGKLVLCDGTAKHKVMIMKLMRPGCFPEEYPISRGLHLPILSAGTAREYCSRILWNVHLLCEADESDDEEEEGGPPDPWLCAMLMEDVGRGNMFSNNEADFWKEEDREQTHSALSDNLKERREWWSGMRDAWKKFSIPGEVSDVPLLDRSIQGNEKAGRDIFSTSGRPREF